MPALPQQMSCSPGSSTVRPGIARSASRGSRSIRCACFRWQESWNATRSSSGLRAARAGATARSSETSTTFAAPWSFRCEPQPAAFVTM